MNIDKAKLIEFFKWCVTTAKIDVIDHQNAIELHGFASEVGLIPVVSVDVMVDMFLDDFPTTEPKLPTVEEIESVLNQSSGLMLSKNATANQILTLLKSKQPE